MANNTHQQLAERVETLALGIVKRLLQSGRRRLDYWSGELEICDYRTTAANGGILHQGLTLTDNDVDGTGDLTAGTVGDGDQGGYILGDFNAWQKYPTIDDLLAFSESWKEIADALDALEDEQRSGAAKALDNLPTEL